ncbi:uncharacterized protein LOC132266361 [Cornus florida]|uniref:uncharacterized protein LOC132266361 n=1 Tax=Cornus florida TaxID=4283 RepID=UPI0028A0FFF2|nr:uncharacterized protein LOC132266361 [Cornus florida]
MGVPAIVGQSKRDVFHFLLDRVQDRLSSWKANTLSSGEKEVLVKAVLSALPTYVMSSFRLRRMLCLELMKKIRSFWWCNSGKDRSNHWVHWDLLCRHKKFGGLGFQDFEAFNLALLTKHAWNLQLHISRWDKPDTLIWAPERNGSFSVRSAYALARSFSDPRAASSDGFHWRVVWRCATLSKIQHFLWRCCHNALPTGLSLLWRGCVDSLLCSRCGMEEESLVHLFFRCSHSVQVWRLSPFHLDFSSVSFHSFLDGWSFFIWWASTSPDQSLALGLMSFCAWFIWKARNHRVFHGLLWSLVQVAAKAVANFWEFQDARSLCSSLASSDSPSSARCWVPPAEGMVKCNFDASFSSQSSRGSGGAVFRDCRGHILHAVVFRPFLASSALMTEAYACLRAIFWASSFGYQRLCFESDAKGVVDAVQDASSCPFEIASICFDIRMDLQSFAVASLEHVRCLGNQVAHDLAMLSRDLFLVDQELFSLPPHISASDFGCHVIKSSMASPLSKHLDFLCGSSGSAGNEGTNENQ